MIRSCNRLMTSFKEVDWWRHFQYLITSSYIGSWSVNYTPVTWPSQLCQQSLSLHNGYISGTKFRFIPCLEVYILGSGVYTPPPFPCIWSLLCKKVYARRVNNLLICLILKYWKTSEILFQRALRCSSAFDW